jgi:hypothetical protein
MRRMLTIAMTAVALTAGCAQQLPSQPQAVSRPAVDWPAGVKEAEVYEQVLRRYLSTPADNSFPDTNFTTVYVLDHAQPDAANPTGRQRSGIPIPPNTQTHITSALAQVASVTFIADKTSVLDTSSGCAKVRNSGILITLGTVDGDDNEAKVGIFGFVACLGATWLTYVLHNEAGSGWRVTGTTGPMGIA